LFLFFSSVTELEEDLELAVKTLEEAAQDEQAAVSIIVHFIFLLSNR